jgi:PhnB protein
MTQLAVYLNFSRNAESAFLFYKSVFGGEFSRGGIARFGDIPASAGAPPLQETDKNLVMHVELEIPGGYKLMGSDTPEFMGYNVVKGNNTYIMVEPETRMETKRIFDALAADGSVMQPLEDVFWGSYYGSCTDMFGVQWMFNCTEGAAS